MEGKSENYKVYINEKAKFELNQIMEYYFDLGLGYLLDSVLLHFKWKAAYL